MGRYISRGVRLNKKPSLKSHLRNFIFLKPSRHIMSSARAGFGDMPDFFLQYPAQAAFFDGLDRMNEAVSACKAGRFEEAEAKAKEGIRQVLLRARPSSD